MGARGEEELLAATRYASRQPGVGDSWEGADGGRGCALCRACLGHWVWPLWWAVGWARRAVGGLVVGLARRSDPDGPGATWAPTGWALFLRASSRGIQDPWDGQWHHSTVTVNTVARPGDHDAIASGNEDQV